MTDRPYRIPPGWTEDAAEDNLPALLDIATRLRECALGWEPNACLLGNVTAKEIADLTEAVIAYEVHKLVEALDALHQRTLRTVASVASEVSDV